jgi:hypothetical protein
MNGCGATNTVIAVNLTRAGRENARIPVDVLVVAAKK